jgi:hypothetical protein
MKEMGDMTGMTRIDENRHLTTDQIGVAIVFIGVLPQIGIETLIELHPLPLYSIRFIWNDCRRICSASMGALQMLFQPRFPELISSL